MWFRIIIRGQECWTWFWIRTLFKEIHRKILIHDLMVKNLVWDGIMIHGWDTESWPLVRKTQNHYSCSRIQFRFWITILGQYKPTMKLGFTILWLRIQYKICESWFVVWNPVPNFESWSLSWMQYWTVNCDS